MFSSCPVSAFVAGVKMGGSIRSDSRSPAAERDAAHGPRRLVVLPARAHEVPADDALDREHLGLQDDHRAPLELVAEAGERVRVLRHVGGDDVVGHHVREEPEPEQRHLRQQDPLAGDAGGQDDVEGAQAVRGHHEEAIAQVVDVADLSLPPQGEAGETRLQEWRRLRIDLHRPCSRTGKEWWLVLFRRPGNVARRRAGSLPESRSARQERNSTREKSTGGPRMTRPCSHCRGDACRWLRASRAPPASPAELAVAAPPRAGPRAASRVAAGEGAAAGAGVASAGAAVVGFATARSAIGPAGFARA